MNKGFKSFEEIEAWKRGCRLAVDVYRLTSQSNFEKEWSLKDQLRRSVISISSNIAEGFERDSAAEFKKFCNIAKGSCGELRTQLYITQAVGLIDRSEIETLVNECKEISSMLYGIIHSLYQKTSK